MWGPLDSSWKCSAPLTAIIILQYSPKKLLFFLFPGGMGGDMHLDFHDLLMFQLVKMDPGQGQDSVKTLGSTSGSLALG